MKGTLLGHSASLRTKIRQRELGGDFVAVLIDYC